MGEPGKENTHNSYPAKTSNSDLSKFLFTSLQNPATDT